ncbi:amidohydrolase [Thalassovita sp.]|uniref:amidohydrolase n=1 Tax=Thalassovita sp. TaxID=1979401 RepID=UPI0029DE6117|nr:amidohydrolase [Thalassovita sp.]
MSDICSPKAVLTNSDIVALTEWRRELHRHPELSGEEEQTAKRVIAMLQDTNPDQILTPLGGHGVAAIYEGRVSGPSVLLRCEMDGLPIEEINPQLPHRSQEPGKGHLCGHDGHMATLAGTARWLGRNRPTRGRVILLFQPAEEDGSGAENVIADPRFNNIVPDYAFAMHNFPSLPLGHAVVAAGPMNCASRGMKIILQGLTAHASQPEKGSSPAIALSALLTELAALGHGDDAADPNFALVTVTHAKLGEPAFGISPGHAELRVTLRTQKDETMAALVARAEHAVAVASSNSRLKHTITYHDVFNHCENDPDAADRLKEAMQAEGIPLARAELPMRGSEDFGRFRNHAKAAMFLLGSGTDSPSLHNPDFDFPDELISIGALIFVRVINPLCYESR